MFIDSSDKYDIQIKYIIQYKIIPIQLGTYYVQYIIIYNAVDIVLI